MSSNQNDFIRLDCPRCGATLQDEGDKLTCQYCGAKLILKRSAANQGSQPGNRHNSYTVVNGLTLNAFAYYDPQSGLEAFSILVPKGWQVSGGVTWVPTRPAAPVQISLQLANPDNLDVFEAFPFLYFTWTSNFMMQMSHASGSLYFGYEVR